MVASVWPVRRSTPPFLALSGKICPGLPKSLGVVCGLTSAFTVLDLKNLIDKGEKRFDYIIRSGDKIVIPRTQDFIKLSGEPLWIHRFSPNLSSALLSLKATTFNLSMNCFPA